jgi:RHS repeat-associated protein
MVKFTRILRIASTPSPAGFDIHTNQTTTLAYIDLASRLAMLRTVAPWSSLVATQIVMNGLLQTESSHTVSTPTWHYYDGLAREIGIVDPLGFVDGSRFDTTTGQLLATTNKNGQVTTYQYYPAGVVNAGLLYCQTGPTGKRTLFNYNSRGQQTHVWGDTPYPEKRDFNSFGDLVSLSTYRGGTLWAGTNWPASPGVSADVTSWNYDEPTGLLTNKTDAAGQAVSYGYTLDHQPQSRVLGRGDSSTNTFESNGDLVLADFYGLQNYSVITTNYNRFGLPRLVIDNSGSHVLTYDYAGRLIQDQCSTGLMSGTALKLRYHPVHGKDQVSVETISGGTTNTIVNTFGFDAFGRIKGVTNGTRDVTYGYLADSDLISTTTSRSAGSTVLTATRRWDYGYRLKSIDNVIKGVGSVSSHEYIHDKLDRRRRAHLADGSAWEYTYNDRDEVTRAGRFWSDFTPVAGQQFEFGYDPIGNRTVAREGGDQYGLNLREEGYGGNNLNQITVRTNSGASEVIGAAYAVASVTVNSSTNVHRKGEYFEHALSGGSSTPTWQSVTNVAILGIDTTTDTGGIVLPPLLQNFSYDADGNLTNDSVWTYTWDAENRLIEMVMTNVTDVPDAKRYKLDFTYDKGGRRVSKVVSTWNGSAFVNAQTNRYVYDDGWNLMAEVTASNSLLRSYTWGLDLTGKLQDAAGIGALLMITEHTNSVAVNVFAYDGNGNVTSLVKADGTVAARYEYGPFGDLLRKTGSASAANPFRASTKYSDKETGLIYFGHRYYDSSVGRWLNRDRINEAGGLNVYAYCLNSPIGRFDPFGNTSGSLGDEAAATGVGGGVAAMGGVSISAARAAMLGTLAKVAMAAYDSYSTYETLSDPEASRSEKVFTAGGFLAGTIVPGGKYIANATKRGVTIALTKSGKGTYRAAARAIFEKEAGVALAKTVQVHHRIPLEYAHLFPGDPNRVANLVAVEERYHRQINTVWTQFRTQLNGRTPTASEIYAVARRIDDEFASVMKFVK